MKITVDILRTSKIRTDHFLGILGLDSKATVAQTNKKLKDEFSPLAIGFKVIWPQSMSQSFMLVGISVMKFDMKEAGEAFSSSLFLADPINVENVNKIDGALYCEMSRLGLSADMKKFTWNALYEKDGN